MLTGKFQMSIFLQNYTPSYKKNPWNSKHGTKTYPIGRKSPLFFVSSCLVPEVGALEPVQQLLDDEERALEEDPMAEEKVLDIVGIRRVGVLHQLANHPVGGGPEQDLGMPAAVLHPPHLAHLGD